MSQPHAPNPGGTIALQVVKEETGPRAPNS
jgi:hypothetical protein